MTLNVVEHDPLTELGEENFLITYILFDYLIFCGGGVVKCVLLTNNVKRRFYILIYHVYTMLSMLSVNKDRFLLLSMHSINQTNPAIFSYVSCSVTFKNF